jgi:hypothetical protein
MATNLYRFVPTFSQAESGVQYKNNARMTLNHVDKQAGLNTCLFLFSMKHM